MTTRVEIFSLNLPPMSAARFRELLDEVPISQMDFARFLKKGPRTVRHWALDEDPVPPYAALLLSLMVHFQVSPEKAYLIAEQIGGPFKEETKHEQSRRRSA